MEETTTFRVWLRDALAAGGHTQRGLARRIAERHPEGANVSTIESARTALRKILRGDVNPSQPTRDAIQEALGRDDAPTAAEEAASESITREMVVEELRRFRRESLRLERALVSGAVAF